jgi:hypothetical protein
MTLVGGTEVPTGEVMATGDSVVGDGAMHPAEAATMIAPAMTRRNQRLTVPDASQPPPRVEQ